MSKKLIKIEGENFAAIRPVQQKLDQIIAEMKESMQRYATAMAEAKQAQFKVIEEKYPEVAEGRWKLDDEYASLGFMILKQLDGGPHGPDCQCDEHAPDSAVISKTLH